MQRYVHGYSERETERLSDQADTLAELLHHDSLFPEGSRVLEVGCGTGAQTVHLARLNPHVSITAVDVAETSLGQARATIEAEGIANVVFVRADIHHLPFEEESFDHVFVCFVLEHLARPVEVLMRLKRVLKEGGSVTVIEGDHGSTFFHPETAAARKAIRCQVELQAAAGGNALIGRELYPLLMGAGFQAVRVSPRMVYVDGSRPRWVDGFTRKTFTAMIEGVRQSALDAGLVDAAEFDRGIEDLYRTAGPDGVFCYTFFKGVGAKGP